MSFGITTEAKPLFLSKKQISKYVDKHLDFTDVPIEYIEKEQETLTIICNLIKLLNVDKILVTQSGSKLDAHLKIDIAIKKGDRYIGFQVKSSRFGYDKYCSMYLNQQLQYGTYNGLAPGCVWLNNNTDKVRFLIALSKWLDIEISDITKDAIRKYQQCKQRKVKNELLIHLVSKAHIDVWCTLGIVKVENGYISYLG